NAATLYHFRLVASNQACLAFGPDLTFSTALPPPPQPTNILLATLTPGTEQVQLVVNGNFQDRGPPDASGDYPNPAAWTRWGTMYVAAGSNMFAADQGLVAQGLVSATNSASGYSQQLTLQPDTDYVLSAYLWSLGDWTNRITAVVDLNDATNEAQLTL